MASVQVVFVSPFEHHSNLLPWREIRAEAGDQLPDIPPNPTKTSDVPLKPTKTSNIPLDPTKTSDIPLNLLKPPAILDMLNDIYILFSDGVD